MTEELQELNLAVCHRRVGRLMRENGIKIVRTQKYLEIQGDDRQQSYVQHCAQFAGSGILSGSAEPEVGWRHQLHLDQRRLAVFSRYLWFVFSSRHQLGR